MLRRLTARMSQCSAIGSTLSHRQCTRAVARQVRCREVSLQRDCVALPLSRVKHTCRGHCTMVTQGSSFARRRRASEVHLPAMVATSHTPAGTSNPAVMMSGSSDQRQSSSRSLGTVLGYGQKALLWRRREGELIPRFYYNFECESLPYEGPLWLGFTTVRVIRMHMQKWGCKTT